MSEMKPDIGGDGVPRCSEDECPAYDGKRCELTARRPSVICEPAVIGMVDRLREPAPGAAAMREAAAQVCEIEAAHYAAGVGGLIQAVRNSAILLARNIRALPLPAPEVPE